MKKTELIQALGTWIYECKQRNFFCEVCGATQKKMCLEAENEIKKILVEEEK